MDLKGAEQVRNYLEYLIVSIGSIALAYIINPDKCYILTMIGILSYCLLCIIEIKNK